jgi:UvrD-like helicase C-terminal domain
MQGKINMNPSHYQTEVFKHLANRGGHSAVISVAGSGKTWTAIEGIGHIPSTYCVLLSAFNTATRDDFKFKGGQKKYTHVQYSNYNGFGWGICLKNMRRKPDLDEFKTENLLEFVVMKGKDISKVRQPISKIISLFKALNYHTVEEAERDYIGIVDRFNMDIPDDKNFKDILMQTWVASMNHVDHFDYDDQKWMPLHLDLPVPCYDNVLVDEFQDTCPVEMELMLKAANGGQFTGLGDPDQCIYGFKGSNPDNFETFIKRMNAKELPLSICYRCPTIVVEAAQKIVPRIESAPGAIRGSERHLEKDAFMNRVRPGDMVLCRTTDELVSTCMKLIKRNIPAKVRGRDFGGAIEYIIDKVTNRQSMPMNEFITALKEYQLLRTQQLSDQRRDAEISRFEDRCSTIRALADECNYSSEISSKMKTIFSEDGKHGGVDLMTIHKSKGLQNRNVFILRPDLLPHPRAKGRSWMLAEERRLKYVAITRAEENLNWVIEERQERCDIP